jgi:hypothetical protein
LESVAKRGGTIKINDGKGRLKRALTAAAKLDVVLEMRAEIEGVLREELDSADRSFSFTEIDPAVRCLGKHFSNDKSAFLGKYPNYAPSTFKKKCCDGKGEKCGSGGQTR